jgi:hypothetical protein
MSHTDLGQPDLALPNTDAADVEFTEAEAELASACHIHSPRLIRWRNLARSFAEADFTLHYCATQELLYRLGFCRLLVSPQAVSSRWRVRLLLIRIPVGEPVL